MLSINDLKPGSLILIEGQPYQVLEVAHQHIGRGGSSIQTKIRNLKTGQVYSRNYKPSDTFEEAAIEKRSIKFLYHHPVRNRASNGAGRGEFVFVEPGNPKNRFSLSEEIISTNKKWLKPNMELTVLFLDETPINIQLPIKMDLEVKEAPPGIQGDRSSSGTKSVTLETGAIIQVPLFINSGDVVRVNTETGEYVERVSKM